MKPFDLEAALAGKPVVTRDGKMSAREDLQRKIQSLRDQLREAINSLDAINRQDAAANAKLKVGHRVQNNGRTYEITAITGTGTFPKYIGHLVKKDGTLGLHELDLYFIPWNER